MVERDDGGCGCGWITFAGGTKVLLLGTEVGGTVNEKMTSELPYIHET